MATSRIDGVYSNNTRTPHCSTKRPPLLPSTASTRIADPPRQMKTYGFRNSNLNVEDFTGDGLDLDLAGRWSPLACSKCAYTCPTMVYLNCGHTLCGECHLAQYQQYMSITTYVSRYTRALCPFCRQDVAYLPVAVRESFISQLRCFCPDCDTSVPLQKIKKHLDICDAKLYGPSNVESRDFMCPPQSEEEEESDEEDEGASDEEDEGASDEEDEGASDEEAAAAEEGDQQQQLSEVQPRDPFRSERVATDLNGEAWWIRWLLPLTKVNGTQNKLQSPPFNYMGVTFQLEVHAKDAASLVVVDVVKPRLCGRVQGILYMGDNRVADLQSLPDNPGRAVGTRIALKPLVDFTKLLHVPIVIVGRQS